jgi:hypothetical protein
LNTETAVVVAVLIYKLSCLGVGSLFCYLGFRLFVSGIWGNAGDLRSTFGNSKIVLRSAAPGTFFAVLGAVITVSTIWQSIQYDWRQGADTSAISSRTPNGANSYRLSPGTGNSKSSAEAGNVRRPTEATAAGPMYIAPGQTQPEQAPPPLP